MFMNVGLGGLDTPDMITEYIRRWGRGVFRRLCAPGVAGEVRLGGLS